MGREYQRLRPTLKFCLRNEYAIFTARVDLPTPPFPLAIAIIFLIFKVSLSSF